MMDQEFYGWDTISSPKFAEVIKKLGSYESKTWAQVRAENPTGQHPVPLESLIPEAQKRLEVLRLDDLDELVRIRLSGTERVWCAQFGNVLYLLWWDPDHNICPSQKKHT
jgi:hypothetical protein